MSPTKRSELTHISLQRPAMLRSGAYAGLANSSTYHQNPQWSNVQVPPEGHRVEKTSCLKVIESDLRQLGVSIEDVEELAQDQQRWQGLVNLIGSTPGNGPEGPG